MGSHPSKSRTHKALGPLSFTATTTHTRHVRASTSSSLPSRTVSNASPSPPIPLRVNPSSPPETVDAPPSAKIPIPTDGETMSQAPTTPAKPPVRAMAPPPAPLPESDELDVSSHQGISDEECSRATTPVSDYSSRPNSGNPNRFCFMNEDMQQEWSRRQPRHAVHALNPENIHCLVVDDEYITITVVARHLRNCRYKVTTARDGSEAVRLLEENPNMFQLVLTDINMPVMSGYELLRRIRRNSQLSEIPVVMMSATEDLDVVYRCTKDGADDYLLKPIRTEVIKNLWQNVWRRRKENIYAALLHKEKKKRDSLQKQLVVLEEEIDLLKNQVSEAIDTPINVISNTIRELISDHQLTDGVKQALAQVLQSLGTSDLYQPAFLRVTEGGYIDETTQEYLLSVIADKSGMFIRNDVEQFPEDQGGVDTEQLSQFDFDLWIHNDRELLPFFVHMFQHFNLLKMFNVPMDVFQNFMLQVRQSYHQNPYHNFRHAFDVTQFIFSLLTTANAASMLSFLDIFALLLAAVCHDLEHPGLNNNFQIATESDLAIQFNDKSVLENFHCFTAFKLISKPEFNVLCGLSPADRKEARCIMVNSILATDMARHMEIVTKFSAISKTYNREKKQDRQLLCEVLLKTADISNPVRPFTLARYWSDLLQEEFFNQGNEEQKWGLPISPHMDRNNEAQARMSVNFIDYLVFPLLESLYVRLPKIAPCVEQCKMNRDSWAFMLGEEGGGGSGGGGTEVEVGPSSETKLEQ